MYARDIKDLSIALEALTRVQGVEDEFSSVKSLLNNAISNLFTEQRKATKSNPGDIPF